MNEPSSSLPAESPDPQTGQGPAPDIGHLLAVAGGVAVGVVLRSARHRGTLLADWKGFRRPTSAACGPVRTRPCANEQPEWMSIGYS
jgi:hypothetical protein